ncbi:hypothetical protein NBZ79_06195 [Sneathiella marina]|uniref:Uncharacterized protein n=1 Tax=Sneathiella marina TaxID=2950108 RepID=A0ABY4W6W0_9PROT|nr:hypothetical protein [Sneathiella marina]USG62564.1 hypothetical protein NBZ79_06195 [Sneathiella marina]
MKTFLSFTSWYFVRDLFLHTPLWVRLWVLVLMAVMFFAPLFFLQHSTAKWMVAAFLLGGMIMGWMHMKMGITKAMGVAHIPWLLPMALIYADLFSGSSAGNYFTWLIAACAIGTICLIIDALDIISFLRGNRAQSAPPAP